MECSHISGKSERNRVSVMIKSEVYHLQSVRRRNDTEKNMYELQGGMEKLKIGCEAGITKHISA